MLVTLLRAASKNDTLVYVCFFFHNTVSLSQYFQFRLCAVNTDMHVCTCCSSALFRIYGVVFVVNTVFYISFLCSHIFKVCGCAETSVHPGTYGKTESEATSSWGWPWLSELDSCFGLQKPIRGAAGHCGTGNHWVKALFMIWFRASMSAHTVCEPRFIYVVCLSKDRVFL